MGEDAWYFGGDELLLISPRDDFPGYESLNIQGDNDEDE